MSHTPNDDRVGELDRSFLTSAELEKIHTLHRQRLREQMSVSLEDHIAKARDQVAEEARNRLNDTFQRTREHFTHIERELVLTLNRVLTGKYERILADLKERNSHLYQLVSSLRDHIGFSTRRTTHSEERELVSEILMAIIVLVVPALYTFFPQVMTTTALAYIVPTFYVIMVVGLLYWRHTFAKLRKSEAEELDRLVNEKENAAKGFLAAAPQGEAGSQIIQTRSESESAR